MLSNLIPVALALMTAVAQPTAPQVTHVEGTATLDRGHIRTSGGRIEMVWPDGTVLHVDAATDLRLEDSGTVAVADGRLVLRTAGATVRLQAPYALLTLDPYGIYS
ncbi:MAG: hypothetical protein OEW19_20205, partial [Acidobacteriota bacterium]|nr:hypothetical protein [Acidobacteriota bacterium]